MSLSTLVLIGLVFVAIALLLRWSNRPQKIVVPTARGRPATGQMQQRLNRLVRGDRRMAQRLLQRAAQRFPDRDEHWIYDKVIYDLERDRRV